MSITRTLIEMMAFFLLALAALTVPAMGATHPIQKAGVHVVIAPTADGLAEGKAFRS
jgi:hypothetical protein